ncbi:aldo/keto reductase [Staphylococcus saprophyticus]|uniref:aldo/keto reductase n=1 Tax=Staphylococcus saprophyticus TaxID=29385 RepID=UPI000254B25C|nr:aldo/keto reductase [Staphylococcus saprophyticus]EHY91466.1 aldo keto reductase family protein [Staphylococcus saprophyticus subsp. saprophyticus KACC 16562]MDW4238713.1 aldo/keto reductase [Staphylococcus saprophyticus]MDW4243595.1 aldo/keto reductase [Staphylococcus saprophyticus]MDW4248507.1 aldo/keto reductase [Staphylococcus saprophyticus]SUM66351.1 aldo keto reductase [Staphylococcus saprophyticus]
MQYTTFNNGHTMPQLGLGVFRVENSDTAKDAVKHAIVSGYRSIDAAFVYGNEEMVGQGIQEGILEAGIQREDLFITSKLWLDHYGKDNVQVGYETSLKLLGLDYLDLYLIHWPGTDQSLMIKTWEGMEALYNDGKVKNIGVSNFDIEHLETLKAHTSIKPVIDQVEFHPYLIQQSLRDYLASESIQMESWSPLMNAEILTDETIVAIADEIGKSPAQVVIRWNIEHGVVTIPKSVTPHRIEENINIFDFSLTQAQIARIDALNQDHRIGPNPLEFNG